VAVGSVAIIGGQGLGDNLLEMILAENAYRAGLRATMFCSRMCQLAAWFPQHSIVSTLSADICNHELSGFQYILFPKRPWLGVDEEVALHWVNYENMYRKGVTRAENMADICRQVFGIVKPTKNSGIIPPADLQHRRNSRRVCIHPTSAEISKNWLPEKFLALGARLQAKKFEVVFIMSAAELGEWKSVVGTKFPLQGFKTVDECAAFLYESGYFIGNDSGGGHLASSLDIPTLSIHGRRGKASMWRPDWGQVEVVTPRINVPGGSLRQHLWKYFLSVTAVERGFNRLLDRQLNM
jgi:hypothetical protein